MKIAPVFLFIAALAAIAPAAEAAEPEEIIRQIYADHQPWTRKFIDFGDTAGLRKYFDESLVALIQKDIDTSVATESIGCMDFDPLLDAQDFDDAGITSPQIRRIRDRSRVLFEVAFTGRSEAWKEWKVKLLFELTKTPQGWRVHDITYKSGHALRAILGCAAGEEAEAPVGISCKSKEMFDEGGFEEHELTLETTEGRLTALAYSNGYSNGQEGGYSRCELALDQKSPEATWTRSEKKTRVTIDDSNLESWVEIEELPGGGYGVTFHGIPPSAYCAFGSEFPQRVVLRQNGAKCSVER